jgi:hypothetical protein
MPFNIEKNGVSAGCEIVRVLYSNSHGVPYEYARESDAQDNIETMFNSKQLLIYNPTIVPIKPKWEQVPVPGRTKDSHTLWRETQTGRYSFADQSGGNPSRTDDGPLFVIPGSICEASIYKWGKGELATVLVRMPVEQASHPKIEAFVHCELAHFRAVKSFVPLKLKMGGATRTLFNDLLMVEQIEKDFTK